MKEVNSDVRSGSAIMWRTHDLAETGTRPKRSTMLEKGSGESLWRHRIHGDPHCSGC